MPERYLIHSPFFASTPEALQAGWKQMEDLQATGKVRSIGVSNFSAKHLATVLVTATIKPATNQIEVHPYLQQTETIAFTKKSGIQVESFAPLTSLTRAKGGPVDAVVTKLAAKYQVSESAVLLKWVLQQDCVVITTSNNESRLKDYLDRATGWELESQDVEEIAREGSKHHFRGFFAEEYEGA